MCHEISDSWLCIFAVELATTHLALLVVHVKENGLNLSVELMVLLTSFLAMLAARTHSESQLVACSSSLSLLYRAFGDNALYKLMFYSLTHLLTYLGSCSKR